MYFRINPDDGTATPLSQQATRHIASNADKSVAVIIQTSKDPSRDIYNGDLLGSSLVTYDVESGKERWRVNMSQELVNSYRSYALWNLSYDGRYLFAFEPSDSSKSSEGDSSSSSSSSSRTLNTLKVYDTKIGAASSMTLPGDIGSSFSMLSDSDSKLIVLTNDDKRGYRLSVFSTGIRMNPIDSFTKGGNPLLIVLIGVVAALMLVLVVLVLELRARKKWRSLFAFLGRLKAVAGSAGAVPAVTTMGAGAVGPVGAVSTPGVGVPATASATPAVPAVSVLGAGLPPTVTPAAVPAVSVIGASEVPAPVAPVAPVSVLGAAPPAPSASSVPAPATVPPAPRVPAPGPPSAVAPPPAPAPDPVSDVTQLSPSSVGAAIPAPPAAPASADAQPRFCRHCGNQLSNPNSRFCTKCGKPVA